MLKIRLRRTGRKGAAFYRVVVAEHTARPTGKYVDLVGHFNPKTKELTLNKEQIQHWLNNGAQPTNRVAKLLVGAGVEHKLVNIHTRPERATKNPGKYGEEAAPAGDAPTEAADAESTPETSAEAPEAEAAPEEAPATEEKPAE